ncbi:MAG: T9SS type A sorting domain-containing protein [Flavobacteriales bacterium]|nr:T9SS type A sorting domain-containing protein [Flavobacteriales bacterium]
MVKNILSLIGLTLFFVVAIIATTYSTGGNESVYAFSSGSPGARTSSPADGQTCTGCHGGTVNSGAGVATITAPSLATGYVPGQTYTITGTIVQNAINKFGFEITAEKDVGNTKIGTIVITDAVRTKLVNANKAATHNSGGTAASGTNSWSFDWIAPVAGTGSVTFYGAFNSTNSNGSTSGDNIYTTSLNVAENTGVGVDENIVVSRLEIYPNPAINYFQISHTEKINGIEIYNLSGKKVMEINQPQDKINIESLLSGVYFVKINGNNGVVVEKLVINKR